MVKYQSNHSTVCLPRVTQMALAISALPPFCQDLVSPSIKLPKLLKGFLTFRETLYKSRFYPVTPASRGFDSLFWSLGIPPNVHCKHTVLTVRFWKSNREQALLCMFLQENSVHRRPVWGDSVLCVCARALIYVYVYAWCWVCMCLGVLHVWGG